jgi:hypothetical protein
MKTGYQIAQLIKEIKSDPVNDRLARAMFVANAVAFHVALDPSLSLDALMEQHQPAFRKILSEVNENTSVDTKSALVLFREAVRIRLDLINGVTDPSLIEAALRSCTAELHQNAQETATVGFLVSRPEFTSAQLSISQILSQHFAAAQ